MSPINCLLKYFVDVMEVIHSRNSGVRVGGLGWVILPTSSRMGVTKRIFKIAIHTPNLAGTGDANVVEMLSFGGINHVGVFEILPDNMVLS